MTSSVTGGEGPAGGHAMRNARNLLQSSTLYMAAERFGRSIKLKKRRQKYIDFHMFAEGSWNSDKSAVSFFFFF